jgi:hypothetical protein
MCLFITVIPQVNPRSADYLFSLSYLSPSGKIRIVNITISHSHPPAFPAGWTHFLNILQIFLAPVKTYFKTSKKSHRFHTFPSIPAAFPHTHGEMSPDFLLKMYRFFFVFFRKCVRVIPYANTFRNLSISVSASFVYNGGFYFGNCRKRT